MRGLDILTSSRRRSRFLESEMEYILDNHDRAFQNTHFSFSAVHSLLSYAVKESFNNDRKLVGPYRMPTVEQAERVDVFIGLL